MNDKHEYLTKIIQMYLETLSFAQKFSKEPQTFVPVLVICCCFPLEEPVVITHHVQAEISLILDILP